MSSFYDIHICRGDSSSCIYCISHAQQAYQVAKLFRSSYCNSYNWNDQRQRTYETPPIFSHRSTITSRPVASSNLDTIDLHENYQVILQSVEEQTLLTRPTLAEISSENVVIEPTDAANSSAMSQFDYFVQEEIPRSFGDRASIWDKSMEVLTPVNVENTMQSQTSSFSLQPRANIQPGALNEPETMSNTLLNSTTETIMQNSLPKAQKTKRRGPSIRCQCPNCSVDGGNNIRGSNGKLQHVCHINGCGKVFYPASRLKKHFNSHSSKNVCPIVGCAKMFVYKKNLEKHMSRHNGKIYFFCEYCDKKFTSKRKLKVHIQVHMTGYACHIPVCRRIFKYDWYFKKHLDWHTGQKNFFCAHCDRGFARKSALSQHARVHLNSKDTCK